MGAANNTELSTHTQDTHTHLEDQIIRGPPVAFTHGGAVITVTTAFPVEDDNNKKRMNINTKFPHTHLCHVWQN